MDHIHYYAVMKAVVMYIELHIEQAEVNAYDLEQAVGFSYPHNPMSLKLVSNSLGEDNDYPFIMAASGAAFRLTWDVSCWNHYRVLGRW